MIRAATKVALLAASLGAVGGCSVLLDWNDLSGGTGGGDDAASEGDAGGDAGADADGSPPTEAAPGTCSGASQCVAAAPSGWTGPVALYVASTLQGAPPACGSGFASTPAFDGNGQLQAPPSTCTSCGCGTPAGESCQGPTMSFYVDPACDTPFVQQQTPTSTCQSTLPIASSVQIAAATVTEGTCAPSGGTATTTPPTWSQVARACVTASAPSSAGCKLGEVCAPTAGGSFTTAACVMQAGAATACPAGYPAGPQVFYTGVDDERACSACTCAIPTGAACSVASPAVKDCSTGTTFAAPTACAAFTGGDPVELLSAPVLSNPGSCAVAGGGAPAGSATGTGATSFCCGS